MTSDKLYYRIGEASEMLGVKPSTLRFWEKEFPQIKPKRKHEERFYTREDLELFKKIKFLVHEEKYTIEGAKRKLRQASRKIAGKQELLEALKKMRKELKELKKRTEFL